MEVINQSQSSVIYSQNEQLQFKLDQSIPPVEQSFSFSSDSDEDYLNTMVPISMMVPISVIIQMKISF